MTVEAFWAEFLRASGLPEDTWFESCFAFGMTGEAANELLRLVLEGKKRATCSSRLGYEVDGEPLPTAGGYDIIIDGDGEPCCVIRTTAVRELPFSEVTFDLCCREGEDDCLESWQENHRRFFRAEGKALGYTFTEDMPVIFEEFEVLWQKT